MKDNVLRQIFQSPPAGGSAMQGYVSRQKYLFSKNLTFLHIYLSRHKD